MVKRPLGIGKALKEKKKKQRGTPEEASAESEGGQEIAVELSESANADDELDQLRALWKTYEKSDKDNELVINGIIHECDRLLRNNAEETPAVKLEDDFHEIYALALSRLAFFHSEDNHMVQESFNAALERADLGLYKFPESAKLLFAKVRIMLSRIPLQYISQMTRETTISDKFPNVCTLLDDALAVYSSAESKAEDADYTEGVLEALNTLDDILDMSENFGSGKMAEGLDSDEEDEDSGEDGEDTVDLAYDHPLSALREEDKYNDWWREHILSLYSHLKESDLQKEVARKIGQSYLMEAERPAAIYTTLTYGSDGDDDDDDDDDENDGKKDENKEMDGLTAPQAVNMAKKAIKTAIKYLEKAKDPEDPQTLADLAEAKISLGNLYPLESEDQEKQYKEAEDLLRVANNSTHGKYEDILSNLLGN